MRVLVTGATGFIGSHILGKLAEKHEVYGTGRRKSDLETLIRCDLNDFNQVRNLSGDLKPDVIVHAAASANLQTETATDGYLNNVSSTLNLLKSSIEFGTKKIIFLSSNMLYGLGYSVEPETADSANPQNWYAESKWICEKLLKDNADRIPSVILRLPSVLGWEKTTTDVVHDMIHSLKSDKKIVIFGDGTSKRQFIHIDDLSNLIDTLISKEVERSVIPVVHSEALPIGKIAEKIISYGGYGELIFDRDRKGAPDQYVTPKLVDEVLKPKISLDHYLRDLKNRGLL